VRGVPFAFVLTVAGCNAAGTDSTAANCAADTDVSAPLRPVDRGFLDAFAPVVVQTEPVAGDQAVDPSLKHLTVVFSADMQDQSWSWVQYDAGTYPEVNGDPEYIDARTNIIHVVLEPNHTYSIGINDPAFAAFQSVAGKSAVPYLLSFHTRGKP
jgi:hypothetical protein